MRKRGMKQAQRLSELLDEFVRERRYVPERVPVIESLDDLPLRLQARAKSAGSDTQWRAWTDGHRIWFIVARPIRVPGQQAREITLQMRFYDHDGALAAAGVWLRRVTGHWMLYGVLDDEQDAVQDAVHERAAAYGQLALAS